ncbi:uncharacterized protein LOC111712309 [Eurytemora carolleeae]|uniref:uncharacterized protein LOC111712309 n=1 Tax=Eurytemora carolleeae TaxID=1294199 RepID=UPI000C76A551|nr:uncharacterized protein LOC111712309 [Eurytemora carolleeae]|eukprot:XP_023342652.1 uncharacterized protein LOC111712309 [Eurytemora affinis]
MTIQENGQIETTTSGSRFPYTYVRKSTPKPKPEIVFNFPTAAETKMTDKTTEISEKKTKTGKRRDGGFSSENDFFAELSSLRGNKNELNVVFVDGIPTSQADLLVTTKSPFDVISVNNLLTPDVDEKTRVKLNKV